MRPLAGTEQLAAAVGDTGSELAFAHDAFARAQNSTLDEIVLVLPKPWARDAAGANVPVTMTTDGTTVTLTVDPARDAQWPILLRASRPQSVEDRCA